eukprot:1143458-Pelagomonas_calceolata.AAC.3
MQLIVVWNLHAREALDNANKDWLRPFKQCLGPRHTRNSLATSKFCRTAAYSEYCPQARAAFHPATYKETFTSKIKNWREISNFSPVLDGSTYTDCSVIQHKDDSPPFVGSGAYKPNRDTTSLSQHLQLHISPNGHGPTHTINRAELAGFLVALQQGHTAIASDSASCLSQISKQTFDPMCMRTHLHAELIRAISN